MEEAPFPGDNSMTLTSQFGPVADAPATGYTESWVSDEPTEGRLT